MNLIIPLNEITEEDRKQVGGKAFSWCNSGEKIILSPLDENESAFKI